MKVSVSWATRREGNSGYVVETYPDASVKTFGPMPSHIVPAFVAARRFWIHRCGARLGGIPVPETPEDFSYLHNKDKESLR